MHHKSGTLPPVERLSTWTSSSMLKGTLLARNEAVPVVKGTPSWGPKVGNAAHPHSPRPTQITNGWAAQKKDEASVNLRFLDGASLRRCLQKRTNLNLRKLGASLPSISKNRSLYSASPFRDHFYSCFLVPKVRGSPQ